MKSKQISILFLLLFCVSYLNTSSQTTSAIFEETEYTFKIASCVGTKASTAWIGNNVVLMIEGEKPGEREQQYMDSVLTLFDMMEGRFIELTDGGNLPLASGYYGKPVIEIVNDNCEAGGLANHGSLGMSTGKNFFDEVYQAAKNGKRAIHQVFLYETNRNFWLQGFNDKHDWAMNYKKAYYGWWTVGMNNAQAVMMTQSMGVELLYFGQDRAQFREGMVSKFETYLNNGFYSFDYGWNQSLLPWRQGSSINDLMSGLYIYSYENFGGDEWLSNLYKWMQSDEIPNRSDVFDFQTCRDNVYKIWSLSANRDLRNFFEVDMRWMISSEAKLWMDSKLGNPISAPGQLKAYAEDNNIVLAWTDNADNETDYIMERSNDGTSFSELEKLPGNTLQYIDLEVSAYIDYAYRIKALNNADESGYSNTVVVNTSMQKPVPPQNITTSGLSEETIRIQWDDTDGKSEFVIEQKDGSGGFVQIGGTAATNTRFEVKDLPNSLATYTFRMASMRNGIKSEYTPEFTESTLDVVPERPRTIRLELESDTSLLITWRDVTDNEDGFVVYQKKENGSWEIIAELGENVTEVLLSDLEPDTRYQYKMISFNEIGNSEPTAPREITTGTSALNKNQKEMIKVFPNPTREEIHVTNPFGNKLKISIMNLGGQEVLVSVSSRLDEIIDISYLKKGLYFVKVDDGIGYEINKIMIH